MERFGDVLAKMLIIVIFMVLLAIVAGLGWNAIQWAWS